MYACNMSSIHVLYVETGNEDVLQQVVIPIVNWNTCHNLNSDYQYWLTQNMICAGPLEGKKDSCYGDSGGPLVCRHGEHWFEHGIVSFCVTDLCAESNAPGVYASVVALQSWIQQHTGS